MEMEDQSRELDPQSVQLAVLKIIADRSIERKKRREASELCLDDDLFEDLGADDLDQKELIISIEEILGIHVEETESKGIKKISDIVTLFQRSAQIKRNGKSVIQEQSKSV